MRHLLYKYLEILPLKTAAAIAHQQAAERMRAMPSKLSSEEAEAVRERNRRGIAAVRERETPEQSAERRFFIRKQVADSRAAETPEQSELSWSQIR